MQKFINNVLQSSWQLLKPAFDAPTAYSWQGLARLTVFSFGVAVLCWVLGIVWVRELSSALTQVFLIFTVQWWGVYYNFKLIPWVTGALVSVLFFGNFTGEIQKIALIAWPIFSGLIAVLPDFVDRDLIIVSPPPEKRPGIVTLVSAQALLSCWLQLGFVVQDWVRDYPVLLNDDFSRSAVLLEIEPISPQGIEFLKAIEAELTAVLTPLSWQEVQQWLQPPQRQENMTQVIQKASRNYLTSVERALWQVDYTFLNQAAGYSMQFVASWNGPQSRSGIPAYQKNCTIAKGFIAENGFQTVVVAVVCDRAKRVMVTPDSPVE
ncbi:MAG: DUF5357 family protein [Jaaginema sp. PMC 1079.18]|nr:DUF5357 family protein [Jaaginema sp. PMC 1080.18]MEC4851643.1 DUF5357 family protein [Jaaginema sp. PMC 1079.18]